MGHQRGKLMLAKLIMEVSRTRLLLGKGQKAPLLYWESLKWEPSPVTRQQRINEGGSLCKLSPAAPHVLLLPERDGCPELWSACPQFPSLSWWAMSGH